ncbi:MAG: hypothetical protein JSW06_01865 [Thermoplasmatales archaeon]|nr:MAG: hypothetical protein JSW06_01865 [Thermoplasmatales archaeon]
MAKENKKLTELGQKQRAGRLLSEYIRAIGDERTEVMDIAISPDEVKHKIVSKAERLARDIWDKALGKSFTDTDGVDVRPDPKVTLEYRKLVIERVEGKVGTGLTGADIEHPGRSIPDRISGQNRDRLNRMAQGGEKKKSKKA